jgi:hypothetical protein
MGGGDITAALIACAVDAAGAPLLRHRDPDRRLAVVHRRNLQAQRGAIYVDVAAGLVASAVPMPMPDVVAVMAVSATMLHRMSAVMMLVSARMPPTMAEMVEAVATTDDHMSSFAVEPVHESMVHHLGMSEAVNAAVEAHMMHDTGMREAHVSKAMQAMREAMMRNAAMHESAMDEAAMADAVMYETPAM